MRRLRWILAGLLVGLALSGVGLLVAGPGAFNALIDATGKLLPMQPSIPLILEPAVNQNLELKTSGTGVIEANDAEVSTYPLVGYETLQTLTADDPINCGTATRMRTIPVVGSGGAVNLTANPQIVAGTTAGQVCKVCGTHATNTVTLDDGTGVQLLVSGGNLVFGTNQEGQQRCEDFVWTGSTWLQAGASSGYGRWLGFLSETEPFRVCEDATEQNCPIYIFMHPTDGPKNRPRCNGGPCAKVMEIDPGLSLSIQQLAGNVGLRISADEIEALDLLQRSSDPADPDTGRCKVYPKADGLYLRCAGAPVLGPLGPARRVAMWDLDLVGVSGGLASHIWNDDPLSTACTPTVVAGTNQTFGVCTFPDSDGDYGRQISRVIPPGWTGTLDAVIWWRTTGSGQVTFRLETMCLGPNATPDGLFNSPSMISAAAGTSGAMQRTAVTGISVAACATENLMRIRFSRNRTETNDTLDAAVEVEKVLFKLLAVN